MEPFRYRIVVEWSEEDARFLARVPALPGCVAHGKTEGIAAHEARKAAEAMLTVLKEDGDEAPPDRHDRRLLGPDEASSPSHSSRTACSRRVGGRCVAQLLAANPAGFAREGQRKGQHEGRARQPYEGRARQP